MYPSNYSWNWNSVDVGPNRDIVGELAAAFRSNSSIKFGLYWAHQEFVNPLWLKDYKKNFTTNDYVKVFKKFFFIPFFLISIEFFKPIFQIYQDQIPRNSL